MIIIFSKNGRYSARCDNNELIITIDKLNNMNESYIIDKIYKGDNNMIHENKSTLDPNHKTKKTDITFKFIDLKDLSVDKYLKQDKYCTEYWDYIHKSCIGEIVIDADSDCIAGYVFLDNKKYPGFITPVVVIKKYRGYGLSSKLVKDAINKYKAIDLTVTKDNEVAIKLYKDNGFVIIGDGNSKNEYWMKLKSKLTDEDWSKSIKEFSIITPSSDKPSQEGFIGHGSWNAIKKVNGEPYRERVEVIIFNKELDKVLIGTKKSDGSVKLPGGGTDKNSSLESQAAKECQEEVKANIDNLKYIGSYSMSNKQTRYKDDVYKGQYTYLYLATYDSDYTGYIRPEDLDSLYDTAEWMNIYDAKKLLKKRSADLYNLFNYNYKLYINDLSYLKL